MDIQVAANPVDEIECEALVIGQFKNQPLNAPAARIDGVLGGKLAQLLEAEEVTGKLGEVSTLLAPSNLRAGQIVLTGLGDAESFGRKAAFRAAAAATKALATRNRSVIVLALGDEEWSDDEREAAVCGSLVGCQGQDLYRKEKNLSPCERLLWFGGEPSQLVTGKILGDAVNLTRRLVNEPPSRMNPIEFASTAAQVATQTGLEVEIWDEQKLTEERCGSLLAVARGSAIPPRIVILRHNGGPSDQPILGLVGKGVTFDSGGLSLKPSDGMKTMKGDMAGAATVVGAMQAIAQLQLPANVMGLVGLVENMVSGNSYKLGDVLQSRNGKTIEVLNTDAEGRLVLADVLDVAVNRNAGKLVDLATLTGACVVALGKSVAGLMTNNQPWCDSVAQAAATCGDDAWQLPMFPEFGEQIRSQVADIKNIGEGRWGGAMTAAKFLEEFVQDTPWVHIDIAGPSFLDKEKSWIDAGGSGSFVCTLVELARQWN